MASCSPPALTAGIEQLRVVIVGHVDHGKSTLIGRLFHDTGSLPEGKLEQLRQVAERRGVPFEWANLTDALQSERDQNVTIDTAQIWFHTAKRQYVIVDAPGHEEFLKNMITGAASAEAALLLIDARDGVQENSRRHGYLLHLLGIRQIAVLVNKMDLEGYRESSFTRIEQEYREWLAAVGVTAKRFIPVAARDGDNLASPSRNMPWWKGPTVVEALDDFARSEPPINRPLRFAVQDVYRFDHRRILAGRVESGVLTVGDRLAFSPTGKVGTVKTIERWRAPATGAATAGESVGITLVDQIFVERGAIAAHESARPYELTQFKARVFWLGRRPLEKRKKYALKLATQQVDCEIDRIEHVIDASTLAPVSRHDGEPFVARHEVGDLSIRVRRPIALDPAAEIVQTGRFVIVDGHDLAGGGIVADAAYPRRMAGARHQSENIYWNDGKVTAQVRALRNGHPGCVVWLTGLSGSGKSTIATELERELFNQGKHVYVLDGDNIRHGLASDLAFSPADRRENIRRVGEVAKLFADAGIIVITAFISPYRSDRDMVRAMMAAGGFVEVFVSAPIEVCERRDPKGLYVKARAGAITDFTGISAPYDAPERPEITIRTDLLDPVESVGRIIEYLRVDLERRSPAM